MSIETTRTLRTTTDPTVGDLAALIADLPRSAKVRVTVSPRSNSPLDPGGEVAMTVSGEPAKPLITSHSPAHQWETSEQSR